MRRPLFFVLGVAITFAIVQFASEPIVMRCLEADGEEMARAQFGYLAFNRRKSTRPAFVFLGGSVTRELFDEELVQKSLASQGIDFYNLGHSARNTVLEQFQALSALRLSRRDHVFVTIEPLDLIATKDPAITPVLESVHWYDVRMGTEGLTIPVRERFRLVLGQLFPWFRYREYLRGCFLDRDLRRKPFVHHIYGEEAEPAAVTQEKLSRHLASGIDLGQGVSANNMNLKYLHLMKALLPKQVHFIEVPRNPLYSRIISPRHLKEHYRALEPLNLIRLERLVPMDRKYFYDFDHVRSSGRREFTRRFLPVLASMGFNR